MKSQILFYRKNKKKYFKLLSAETAHSVVSVKVPGKTVADNILIFVFNYFSEKIRQHLIELSARGMIHMEF